jgi:hypothetical protein
LSNFGPALSFRIYCFLPGLTSAESTSTATGLQFGNQKICFKNRSKVTLTLWKNGRNIDQIGLPAGVFRKRNFQAGFE